MNVKKLLLVALLAGSASSFAEEQRWYAAASVGIGQLGSTNIRYSDGAGSTSASAGFSTSFTGGGTLGYRFDKGWNLEGEIMYRRNELDPVDLGAFGSFSEGDFASLAIGVNALYRFSLGDDLSCYVGPGIVYFQEIDIDFDNDGQQEISFESDDTALQLKFGGRYDFSPRLFFDVSASYLAAGGVSLELPADATRSIDADYDHWSLNVGVGWRF